MTSDYELTFDEAENIGLDGTGMDMDRRFPHTYSGLTEEERVKFWARRCTAAGLNYYDAYELSSALEKLGSAFGSLFDEWMYQDLAGDFIVPELGLPVSMSVDEAVCEVGALSGYISSAAEEYLEYVGRHRRD